MTRLFVGQPRLHRVCQLFRVSNFTNFYRGALESPFALGSYNGGDGGDAGYGDEDD